MTQQEIKNRTGQILIDLENLDIDSKQAESFITNLVTNSMKSESIAFGEWINKNRIYPHSSLKGIWVKANIEYYTSDLYEIFKNENQAK